MLMYYQSILQRCLSKAVQLYTHTENTAEILAGQLCRRADVMARRYEALDYVTPQRRVASAILGDLQLNWATSMGPPGGYIFYFGMFHTNSSWNADAVRRRLQLLRAVYSHMGKKARARDAHFPNDWLNKQQTGKFGRMCLNSAFRAFLSKGRPGSSPTAAGSRGEIFAICLSDLRGMCGNACWQPPTTGAEGQLTAYYLDCESDCRWAPSGPGAKAAGWAANVRVAGRKSLRAPNPIDYCFYGVAMAASAHDGGCCTGGFVGNGPYCHEWMKWDDTRYGLEASYFGTLWMPCLCGAMAAEKGPQGVASCTCLAAYTWKCHAQEIKQ